MENYLKKKCLNIILAQWYFTHFSQLDPLFLTFYDIPHEFNILFYG